MAKRLGMNIESYDIARAKLPSSTTPFNPIAWESSRTLDSFREIDNIAHNGEVKHENCTHYRNLAAVLHEFETEVFPRISAAFEHFSKVVVTADHGSSRLAVIAHEEKMITNLPWSGEPLDWRFSIAPQNIERSQDFESFYDIDNNLTYWIVRGYNRLPKKGGKLSVHGGATPEERLVPIIVFAKNKTEIIANQINNPIVEQIVEKTDFDI
jgi:hypothetical protein